MTTPADFYAITPGMPLPRLNAQQVGHKAWNLMRMSATGLPIPSAFVLPVKWQRRLQGVKNAARLEHTLDSGIRVIESATGLGLGSPQQPLLVSVRSGSAVSMPGMMETVLDVGMNSETVQGLMALTGNPRLAWDSYRRFVQNYSKVVCNLSGEPFDRLVQEVVSSAGVESERELDFRELRTLTQEMICKFEEVRGDPFPDDPREQLRKAVIAVFRSWDAPKAVAYRKLNNIDEAAGTAATIQGMVFGNAGGASGSGVAFTRNPATGEPELYFDFQFNAQGEDIVGGQRALDDSNRLRRTLPSVWAQLQATGHTLESLFCDVQDFEFTLQQGTLYLLQTRSAKRTPWAALRIAVDLVEEGLISPREALARLESVDLQSVSRGHLSTAGVPPLARAIPASAGCAAGVIAFDSAAAERMANDTPVILVRRETATGDIAGIAATTGILTQLGGRTSHAAVVARQLGKVCLVGCADLRIDPERQGCQIDGRTFHEGDCISLDGNEGGIYPGRLETVFDRPERELERIAAWRAKLNTADAGAVHASMG